MRRAAQFIFAMLITGAFAASLSCTSPSTDTPPPLPASAPPVPAQKLRPRIAVPELERQLHDRINKERRKRGLPTMRWDEALGRIAAKHSKDMVNKKYFGHTSPEGHGYTSRYLKSGYACGVTVDGVLRRGAENIYRLSLDEVGNPADATIRGWMANKEDRKNLLSSPWEREGIGICVGPDGVLYITLNFC